MMKQIFTQTCSDRFYGMWRTLLYQLLSDNTILHKATDPFEPESVADDYCAQQARGPQQLSQHQLQLLTTFDAKRSLEPASFMRRPH